MTDEQKETSKKGKRVRWHPIDTDETFDGTIVDETRYFYVVVPDNSHAPTQNWNKLTCEIIDND